MAQTPPLFARPVKQAVWDPNTLTWMPMEQPVIDTDTLNVAIAGPLAVTGPLTDAELRATPVPVSGTVATGGLTDAQLRATAVPVSLAAIGSVVNAANSSSTPLAGNASFTGTSVSVLAWDRVTVMVFSDVSSADLGVKIEFGPDGTNWYDASTFTFTSGGTTPNNGQVFSTAARGQFMRVVYTNGSGAQASFSLQTILQPTFEGADIVDLATPTSDFQHAMLVKSVLVGHTTAGGGLYVNVKVNPSGALAVDGSGVTQPVTGTGTFTTKEVKAATATTTSVNDTASSTTLLASNANRLGATVFNDSTVSLYLKLGATASTSSFTVLMVAASYYEVPFGYTGVIDGIWASDASGAARILELTA
jgi:hypothetical protein